MGRYGMLKSHIIVPIVVMGILILAGSTFGGDEGGEPYKGGLVWSTGLMQQRVEVAILKALIPAKGIFYAVRPVMAGMAWGPRRLCAPLAEDSRPNPRPRFRPFIKIRFSHLRTGSLFREGTRVK